MPTPIQLRYIALATILFCAFKAQLAPKHPLEGCFYFCTFTVCFIFFNPKD